LTEWHSFVKESNEFDESDELNKSDELDKFNKPDEFNEIDEFNKKLQIINEFMIADMRIPELAITLNQYASKFINTHDIAQQYKKRSNQHEIYGMNVGSIPLKFQLM
ncbi:hypothetical protein C2G38_2077323, partial [Gigaspora rosea]